MDTSLVYKKVEECLLEDMDGEILLYNPNNATTLHFNGPSAIVWELCNGENSVQTMIDALIEAYPGQAGQIAGDVIATIKEFAEHQIIMLRGEISAANNKPEV